MKTLVFVGLLGLVLPLTGGLKVTEEEDLIVVPSDMIEQVLEMPIKSMDYYSDRFYPTMIKVINSKSF